jgi:hypothetical protein
VAALTRGEVIVRVLLLVTAAGTEYQTPALSSSKPLVERSGRRPSPAARPPSIVVL